MKQLLRSHSGKESSCQCRIHGFNPCVRKIPWSRKWHPTLAFLPGKFLGQRSLMGYSPWDHKESDTKEQLSPHHALRNRREGGRTQTKRNDIAMLLFSHLVMSNSLPPYGRSPPSSSVHGILQERILDWVAISRYQTVYLLHW